MVSKAECGKIQTQNVRGGREKAHANDGGNHAGYRCNGLEEDGTVEDLILGDQSKNSKGSLNVGECKRKECAWGLGEGEIIRPSYSVGRAT